MEIMINMAASSSTSTSCAHTISLASKRQPQIKEARTLHNMHKITSTEKICKRLTSTKLQLKDLMNVCFHVVELLSHV
jgi:uncharacterized membrane protein YjjP (DUF1212 family)